MYNYRDVYSWSGRQTAAKRNILDAEEEKRDTFKVSTPAWHVQCNDTLPPQVKVEKKSCERKFERYTTLVETEQSHHLSIKVERSSV